MQDEEDEESETNELNDRRIKIWVVIATILGLGLVAFIGYGLYKIITSKSDYQ